MLRPLPPLDSTSCIIKRLTLRRLGQRRPLSINSAIHKGVRKSNFREGAGGLLHYGDRSRGPTMAKHSGKLSRVPRPNHQTNQDPEDVAESRKVNEAKTTVKQRLYREGGRERLSQNGKSTYGPSLFKPKTRPERSASVGKMSGSAKPSNHAMPNRKARRAAVFGHSGVRSSPNEDVMGHKSHPEPTAGLSKVPLSTPYTTPASEFLYGASVVSAALRFSSRKFYKFYSYDGPDRVDQRQDESMRGLARSKGVEVMQVRGEWLRLLDKMSKGRPHNGYVLEASPLPKLPIRNLPTMVQPQDVFHVNLDHQSQEEELINGTNGAIRYNGGLSRYPIILLLDSILDPGNLGALIRTAYFFGVDAVAISTRNCAPLSPVALKSSAGASESLPLLSVAQPQTFVEESQKHGWKFYAAVAPEKPLKGRKHQQYISVSALASPSMYHPCVLMIGAEGGGLRTSLRKKADFDVGVEGQRLGHGGVDSLNVSVAAGVLCQAFLQMPATAKSLSDSINFEDSQRQQLDTGKASEVTRTRNREQSMDYHIGSQTENLLF